MNAVVLHVVSSATAVTLSNFSARPDSQTGNSVSLDWTTTSELNTAGFNVYRSEKPEGPYVRINAQLIPASGEPVLGGKYQYLDSGVDAGKTYYYQLEDVEFNGASVRHQPVTAVAQASQAMDTSGVLVAGVVIGMLALLVGGIYLRRRTAMRA